MWQAYKLLPNPIFTWMKRNSEVFLFIFLFSIWLLSGCTIIQVLVYLIYVLSTSRTSLWIRPKSLQLRQTECWNEFGTLCLHPSSDQSKRITGHLSTGAGYGSTGKQHQNAGIGRIFGVSWQPQVLQALAGGTVKDYIHIWGVYAGLHQQQDLFYSHVPRRLPDLYQRMEWFPGYWGCNPCKRPSHPRSLRFSWRSQTFRSTVPSSSVSAVF